MTASSPERLMIGIDVGRIDVDIESVIQLAEGGRVHPLLLDTPQLDGWLLEGMDDLDPSFRVWVLAKRQTIHERLMRNLDEGMTSRSVPADAKKRIAAAIVNLDPTHEYACRYLMRAHAEEGDICRRVAHLQGAVGSAGSRLRAWSRRRPPKNSLRTSSSAFWSARRPIGRLGSE